LKQQLRPGHAVSREHVELILQDRAGAPDRILRVDGAIGLDVEHQLVEVGALFDARRLDRVGHLANRAEGRVETQAADGRSGLPFGIKLLGGRTIAATPLDGQQDLELAGVGEVGDHMTRVDDFDIMISRDVAGSHRARTLAVQGELDAVTGMHAQGDAFQVEQDLDHVLLHTLDAGVLMEYAFDFGLDDCSTGHARQQNAAQCVTQRVAKAPLKGFNHDTCAVAGLGLHANVTRLQELTD
jgi:hypothetical protein